MIAQLAIATVVIVLNAIVQGEMFAAFSRRMESMMLALRRRFHRFANTAVIVVGVLFVMLVLSVQVWIWAGVFLLVGAFDALEPALYFSLVAYSTVGFGDITPKTELGRFVASVMMLLGWGTLAVPTGIVTSEMAAQRMRRPATTRTCHECLTEGHTPDARFCTHCGARLPPYQTQ